MHEEIIKEIRQRCRMAMNGIVSASMREKGLMYKLNFGLTIQQIKDIAKDYQQDASLSETVWKEDVRELKILATMLYPVSEFTEATAERWIGEITNQEIREQLCLNLLQNFPYASNLVKRWSSSTDMDKRTTGYWLLARLFLAKKMDKTNLDLFPFINDDVISENTLLRNAALLALKHIGRQSREVSDKILDDLSIYKDNTDPIKQEVYNSLHFEFDYYFNG
ncbi:3-methyladenine DNA glycosylase AlkD [Dysgonomonas hofstadii]|uniref:3-methyladenine DNA glycosylase AlkD n=1 Tax=Dysgonomonas hofstadii TaxID=637886 RepID=A0A840CM90_9BACT|nr:DNA alkylation repair protein [Dysgonomonas hofstadii]MBB4037110.1 3-methyladenine DNA glycosylase AlkD [Dysgonomonas hofstadii]